MEMVGDLNRNSLRIYAVIVLVIGMLTLGGCGGSDSTESTGGGDGKSSEGKSASTAAETEPEELRESGSAVSTGIPGSYGRVIVSQVGFTFYSFSKDKKDSGKSACYGPCEKVWTPYVTVAKPVTLQKAQASMLGTFNRKDGLTQVTYGGWPLYTYTPDPAAASGGFGRKSFGGVWYPINVKGEIVR